MKKHNLKNIELESFVIKLSSDRKKTLIGGVSGGLCITPAFYTRIEQCIIPIRPIEETLQEDCRYSNETRHDKYGDCVDTSWCMA